MALLITNEDGTYEQDCPLCRERLTDPIFATSHFIADREHHLWPYSDAAMHWDCYAKWEHQAEFAALHYEAWVKTAKGDEQYWPVLHYSERVLVTFGLEVHELALTFRRSGTQIRVAENEWLNWLTGDWEKACTHELERAAVAEVMEELHASVNDLSTRGSPL